MDRTISARILTALMALFFCAAQASAYTAVAVSNGGSIKGTVTTANKEDETLTISKDNAFCGDSIPAEKFLISGDGGLKNAVVMLEEIAEGKDFDPEADLTVTNKGCHFVPHVMVAPKGALMKVRNDDSLMHNSHFFLVSGERKKNVINLALPKEGMEISKPKILRKPGLLSLQCDAHDFMQAWVWVLEHPYAAVTDSDGSFELSDVPAGSYKLTVWHEALGKKTVDVTVGAGKATTTDFTL
jgi:hypothetical protein